MTKRIWIVYVIAQNVTDAPRGAAPEVAATHIGGQLIASPFRISFTDKACPCKADALVTAI
jgi:hypothetical protein